jgi:hypothetical protein
MHDRHLPRLCRSCRAPVARQEDGCWRCGAQWASGVVPPTTLRTIVVGQLARHVTELARAPARVDEDRWMNEGGSVGAEPAGPLPAVAAMG